jgi:hypothetical protein
MHGREAAFKYMHTATRINGVGVKQRLSCVLAAGIERLILGRKKVEATKSHIQLQNRAEIRRFALQQSLVGGEVLRRVEGAYLHCQLDTTPDHSGGIRMKRH